MGKIIGIDLGTSNSVVAAVISGVPLVIPDENGSRIHPSIVGFLATGNVVVGGKARDLRVVDPLNTVYSTKRLIGRPYYSEEIRSAQSAQGRFRSRQRGKRSGASGFGSTW